MDCILSENINEGGSLMSFHQWAETSEYEDLINNIELSHPHINSVDRKILLFAWYQEEILKEPLEEIEPPVVDTEPIKSVEIFDDPVEYMIKYPIKLANSNLDSFKLEETTYGEELKELELV